ncbi:hypothetical protein KFK09_023686 [Dendrobium nobile]|uniref:Uncharacterized protein n=1 Tax=Dendrobium nobile TaxID=94219 RepID=A0A8T3AAW8_DENNO|nr:hypothetical protein KFK09_023686 [Dendrobium nobile]
MAAVKVLHEIQISPSPSLPSQPPQPLSFLDAMWLQSSGPVERLFFYEYPHPTSHFIDHQLPIFTKSLSVTLRHFYPLAGSIRPSPDSLDQFEIAYEEGDSVTITVAEFIGDDFRNISGHHPRSFKNLHLLVPKKPANSSNTGQLPPISIQITLFSNQGLCIGFTINHAACDGFGSMQFIRSWAAACRSMNQALDDLISPPFLDRSIIVDTYGIRGKIFRRMCQHKEQLEEYFMKQGSLPDSDPSLVSATFTLGKDQIDRLKELVKAKGEEEKKPSFHISTFVVTCAYVWRCLLKARGYGGDVKQYFGCAVDWRRRMKFSFPSNYFGNCLGACVGEVKAGDLVGKEGIQVATMVIGKSIDGLQGTDVGKGLEETIDRYAELAISGPLSVAGSPKLRVYEVDFGLGRPLKVEITSIVDTGAMSLAESKEEEGGMEIGLVLAEELMAKFGTNFANDLLDIFK